jgi:hypothetical protein
VITQIAQTMPHLNAETLVPIGGVIVVIVAIVQLFRRIDRMEKTISDVAKSLKEGWTHKDQQIFALEFQLELNKKNIPVQVPGAKQSHIATNREEDRND